MQVRCMRTKAIWWGAVAGVLALGAALWGPIVSNVDPLRHLDGRGSGDVGMMALEERAPGDLDRLEC